MSLNLKYEYSFVIVKSRERRFLDQSFTSRLLLLRQSELVVCDSLSGWGLFQSIGKSAFYLWLHRGVSGHGRSWCHSGTQELQYPQLRHLRNKKRHDETRGVNFLNQRLSVHSRKFSGSIGCLEFQHEIAFLLTAAKKATPDCQSITAAVHWLKSPFEPSFLKW